MDSNTTKITKKITPEARTAKRLSPSELKRSRSSAGHAGGKERPLKEYADKYFFEQAVNNIEVVE